MCFPRIPTTQRGTTLFTFSSDEIYAVLIKQEHAVEGLDVHRLVADPTLSGGLDRGLFCVSYAPPSDMD
jgi:hypothetical protein